MHCHLMRAKRPLINANPCKSRIATPHAGKSERPPSPTVESLSCKSRLHRLKNSGKTHSPTAEALPKAHRKTLEKTEVGRLRACSPRTRSRRNRDSVPPDTQHPLSAVVLKPTQKRHPPSPLRRAALSCQTTPPHPLLAAAAVDFGHPGTTPPVFKYL